jgi:hypothetical protein
LVEHPEAQNGSQRNRRAVSASELQRALECLTRGGGDPPTERLDTGVLPAARDSPILTSPRVHARIRSIACRGRGSAGCTDSKGCRTCSAHAAAHRARSRWSESVSVPPR